MLASLAISLTPIVLDISGEEVVYAREFVSLKASFREMEEGKVERIDDAAHMDVAIGMFYPRVRLIGVRLPREESPFIPYLERATTLMENALLDSDVFLSFDAFRYDSDSNYLSYLWFPYELEGTEVMISANLLLVMNGLCDYVPETNFKGKLHEYMEQAKHYAKINRIGIWSEDENPETSLEARIHTSEKMASKRTLSITVTGDFDTAYSGYIDIQRSYPNTKIRQEIRGTIPHVHVIELDETWDKACFNLTVRVYTKSKGKDMTVTARINNKLLASSSTGPYSPDRVLLFLLSAQYSLD
ncbi:thermonuclease family protein [Mesotoga sp. BH458_6_3_2_1]|uniref:thermonuclease family protein n=1 Tax=Mesotoga sp. BH458_6_3_2_1 TaxID=1437446 RepID=UPI0015FECDD7|nr:thermonuclease family protein [Mesotoga sp. BH458_6_3_2_1]